MIYLLTGNPGAGKSTVAVEHAIYRYAMNGRKIVCNFPIDFAPICMDSSKALSKAVVRVIPDRPRREDLDLVEFGGESEDTAGLLIIDEAGTWLNARGWQEGDRAAILDWLTQSRKRYWDIILIAQAASMLDKQCREAVCEMVATIMRTDRKRVFGMKLPRMHMGVVRYGLEPTAPVLEKWIYKGKDAHACFASYRLFGADATHYSVLPATHTKWRDPTIPKNRRERIQRRVNAWKAKWLRDTPRPRPTATLTKAPLAELLMRLSPDERMRHWRRLTELGAL